MAKEIIEITQPLMSYEGLENSATLYDDGTLSICAEDEWEPFSVSVEFTPENTRKLYEAMKGLFE